MLIPVDEDDIDAHGLLVHGLGPDFFKLAAPPTELRFLGTKMILDICWLSCQVLPLIKSVLSGWQHQTYIGPLQYSKKVNVNATLRLKLFNWISK